MGVSDVASVVGFGGVVVVLAVVGGAAGDKVFEGGFAAVGPGLDVVHVAVGGASVAVWVGAELLVGADHEALCWGGEASVAFDECAADGFGVGLAFCVFGVDHDVAVFFGDASA